MVESLCVNNVGVLSEYIHQLINKCSSIMYDIHEHSDVD